MMIFLYILIGLIILFIVYRWIKVNYQNKKINKERFNRVKPLYEALNNNEEIDPNMITELSTKIENREYIYDLLVEYKKEVLFPDELKTIEIGAESHLYNWLKFPTELDAFPDEIEYLQKVIIDFDGNDVIYHTYKFRINSPHWASKNDWMVGVVGPYFKDSKPYDFPSGTFSRLNKTNNINLEKEVRWVHEKISMRNV